MNTPAHPAAVEALRERIRCLEGRARHRRAILPFGIKAIDERLPEGGLVLGALHEVAGGENGAVDGAAAALFAAGIAARTRGRVLWCVTRQDLFAPALALAGLAPDRVIYVEAGDEKSVLACFEEGLRHGGLGAVVAEVARLSMTASRRLQLAAEGSGAIGIAIRRLPTLPRMGGRVIGARLTNGSRADSLPPCGGGLGWGVGPRGTVMPLGSTPTPDPSPAEPRYSEGSATEQNDRSRQQPTSIGGGEESAVASTANLADRFHETGVIPGRHRKVASPESIPLGQWSWVPGSPLRGAPERLAYDSKFKNAALASMRERAGRGQATDFGQPTAAVTRWRVSALPSTPLPVPSVGRARWRLELVRCRGGESAEFEVEACDAQGRLALPSDLVHGSGQKAIGRRRTAR